MSSSLRIARIAVEHSTGKQHGYIVTTANYLTRRNAIRRESNLLVVFYGAFQWGREAREVAIVHSEMYSTLIDLADFTPPK